MRYVPPPNLNAHQNEEDQEKGKRGGRERDLFSNQFWWSNNNNYMLALSGKGGEGRP